MGVVDTDIQFAPRTLILVSDPGTDKMTGTEFQVWSTTGLRIEGLTMEAPSFSAVDSISYSESTRKSMASVRSAANVATSTQFGTATVRGTSPQYGKKFILRVPVTMSVLPRRQVTQ